MNSIKDIARISLIFIVIGTAIGRLYVERIIKRMGQDNFHVISG